MVDLALFLQSLGQLDGGYLRPKIHRAAQIGPQWDPVASLSM